MSTSSNHASECQRGIFSSRLARELMVVLVVKLIILYIIWLAFFSHPAGPSMTAESVSETFLGVGKEHPQPPPHKNIK